MKIVIEGGGGRERDREREREREKTVLHKGIRVILYIIIY